MEKSPYVDVTFYFFQTSQLFGITMNETYTVQIRFVKFSLLLLFAIPSIFCAIFIIYSFFRYPSIRKIFYHEITILLSFIILIKIFFSISISISYYARGYVQPQTSHFCKFWRYVDYTLTSCVIWSVAIFTIERYLLVFYPNVLRFKRQQIVFHYLPIIGFNLYLVIFYTYGIIILECHERLNFKRHLCGLFCIDLKPGLSQFSWCFHIILPVFITIFGSLILLIRVIWTRRKMQRNLRNWSKNWKMIAQLLGIAVIYIIVWLPLSIISLIDTFTGSSKFDELAEDYMYYFTYITEMSLPIVGFILSPEINRRLCKRLNPNIIHIPSVTTAHY